MARMWTPHSLQSHSAQNHLRNLKLLGLQGNDSWLVLMQTKKMVSNYPWLTAACLAIQDCTAPKTTCQATLCKVLDDWPNLPASMALQAEQQKYRSWVQFLYSFALIRSAIKAAQEHATLCQDLLYGDSNLCCWPICVSKCSIWLAVAPQIRTLGSSDSTSQKQKKQKQPLQILKNRRPLQDVTDLYYPSSKQSGTQTSKILSMR